MNLLCNLSALSAFLLVVGCSAPNAPSDAAVIRQFTEHRADFERLLEMFRHDGIDGRLDCVDSPDPGRREQPMAHRAEYVMLFRRIGCDTVSHYDPDSGKAQFELWSYGLFLNAGQAESIMFIPNEVPQPLVATIDHYRWTQQDHAQGHIEIYRHIEGAWYVEFDAD